MEHPGFFERAGPFTLAAVAGHTGAELHDGGQGGREVADIAPLAEATPSDLTFVDNVKYLPKLADTRAAGCFIHEKYASRCPAHTTALLTREPYRAYAKAISLFYPDAGTPKAAVHMNGASQID